MGKVLSAVGNFFKRTDWIFWILTIAASVYGFFLIYSVSRAADSERGFLATQLLAVALGYPAQKSEIYPMEAGQYRYHLTPDGTLHVPKRSLDEILL